MSSFEQVPFNPGRAIAKPNVFADNPDPRCPVLLLLDKSASMSGEPIEQLNDALQALRDHLRRDSLAAKRAELAVVSFGPVTADAAFDTVENFSPPALQAEGDTPMGRAIELALQMIEDRKRTYKENGVAYYRPIVMLITDGAPTDDWRQAAAKIRQGEEAKRLAFFAVGVDGADFGALQKLAVRAPIHLRGLDFKSLFLWLSASISAVSRSTPGGPVALPPVPAGWGEL